MNLHLIFFDILSVERRKNICILNCEKKDKTKEDGNFVNNSKIKNFSSSLFV